MVKAITLINVLYNGKTYAPDHEIELEQENYDALLVAKAIKPVQNKTSDDDDKNAPPGAASNLQHESAAGKAQNLSLMEPSEEYSTMTNNAQIEYLTGLEDEMFKAINVEAFLTVSKSKAKAYIERRLKALTPEGERVE